MARLHFHATRGDLLDLCQDVESKLEIEYLRRYEGPVADAGSAPEKFDTAAGIPDLGVAAGNDRISGPSFVILPKGQTLAPRRYEARGVPTIVYGDGGHPDAVVLAPGGDRPDLRANVAGEICNAMSTPKAERVLRAFSAAMKRAGWHRTPRRYWIGPEALAQFRAGWTLTSTIDGHPGLAVTAEELPSG